MSKEDVRMLGWRISNFMRKYPGVMEGYDKKNSIKTFGIGISFFGMISLAAGLTSGAGKQPRNPGVRRFGYYCFVPFTDYRPNLGEAILTSTLVIVTGMIGIYIGKSSISVKRLQLYLLSSALALNFSVVYIIRILTVYVHDHYLEKDLSVNLITVCISLLLLIGNIIYVFKNSIDETLAQQPIAYVPNKSDSSQDFRVAIQSAVSPRAITTPPPRFSTLFGSLSKSSAKEEERKKKHQNETTDKHVQENIEDDVFE